MLNSIKVGVKRIDISNVLVRHAVVGEFHKEGEVWIIIYIFNVLVRHAVGVMPRKFAWLRRSVSRSPNKLLLLLNIPMEK